MSAPSRLLQQCLQEALKEAPDMLIRSADTVIAELQQAEKNGKEIAVRDRFARAWWNLLQNKLLWSQTFPQRLKEAFRGEGGDAQLSRPATLSESMLLSLVDENQVNESLESARVLQSIQAVVELELAALDALVSPLLGHDSVRAELNPMRPTIYVRALRNLMVDDEVDADIRAIWLRQFGPVLGRELQKLYMHLVQMLQRANVREAGYRVRLAPDGAPVRPAGLDAGVRRDMSVPGGAHHAPGQPEVEQPVARAAELPPMSQLGRLHSGVQQQVFHQFLEQDSQRFEQPLEVDYYRQVERELEEMRDTLPPAPLDEQALDRQRTQYREVASVDRPAREVGIGSALSAQTWGDYADPQERARHLLQLKQKAQKVSQAVGLDLVRTLVAQVAQDPLLLAPVREAVVALEPALLRQALANPRFFSEDDHPARRLVESVAQRSFKYNDEFSSDFESFFLPVQEVFRALSESDDGDPGAFSKALRQLERGWQAQDEADLRRHELSLESVRHAEERQALADQIAFDISKRPDVENAPGVILEFIYGPWALVLASAQLNNPSNERDPHGYRKALSNLLWSVKREVTLRRPATLFEIVPPMIATLHSGLELLGFTREETKPFFDALMRLHEPVLGLRRARIRSDLQGSGPVPLEENSALAALDDLMTASPEQRRPRPGGQPWLGRGELHAAGFEDTLPSDYADLEEASAAVSQDTDDVLPAASETTEATEATESVDKLLGLDAATVLARLKEGDWVDLYSRREWLRAQLVWASSRGTLFMFVSRGGRPHSMTKRSCERLIAGRLLRPIESRNVVQTALDAMAQDRSKPEPQPQT